MNDPFHRADYLVDNTATSEDTKNFTLPDQLKRLEEIFFRKNLYRPNADERGMYYAQAAAMRSSCLSSQVGASVIDGKGNLLATGSSEVPKAGGGAYDETCDPDQRCFKRGHCSNTQQQNAIVEDIFKRLTSDGSLVPGIALPDIVETLKKTRVKSLIEFSRAVHAEMDALILKRVERFLLPVES